MGKLIYQILFQITYRMTAFILPYKFNAFIRNSYFQNYFLFLKSDLDISINITPNKNTTNHCQNISFFFKLNPLIKEVNFYYLPEMQIGLQNYYEYLRDPSLSHFHKEKSIFAKDERFVFLLRMYTSNYKNFMPLTNRTKLKFEHYFNLADINFNPSNNDEILNQLLATIDSTDSSVIKFEIEYYLKCLKNDQHFEDILKNSKHPEILLAIFPHNFYFLNLDLDRINDQLKTITLLQLSWELWGLSTQPQLHNNNLIYLKNFKNLQHMIHKLNYNNKAFISLKKQIIFNSQNILEKIF